MSLALHFQGKEVPLCLNRYTSRERTISRVASMWKSDHAVVKSMTLGK